MMGNLKVIAGLGSPMRKGGLMTHHPACNRMDEEQILMNRQLLEEISAKKRMTTSH